MSACPTRSQFENWARQGDSIPIPETLTLHAEQCDACAEFLESVAQGRALGQLLPTLTISRARHEEIKFLLMAESRQSRKRGAMRLLPSSLRWRAFAFAAIVATLAGAATAAHRYLATSPGSIGRLSTANSTAPLAEMRKSDQTQPKVPELSSSSDLVATPATIPQDTPTASSPIVRPVATVDGADAAFSDAWQALRGKRPGDAARRFDSLLAKGSLDAARRADILYWSAQAHRQAGNSSAAMNRSTQLLRDYPRAPFAADAALMLGEYAVASDQFELARGYLNQAAASQHAVVRERARRALAKLADRQ